MVHYPQLIRIGEAPLSRVEKLAALLGIGTSLATLVISIVEIPGNPTSFNLWLALGISLVFSALLVVYWARSTRSTSQEKYELERKHRTEEKRLRSEFPAIFTFIESVGEIRNQRDFDQFVAQLNHLLE